MKHNRMLSVLLVLSMLAALFAGCFTASAAGSTINTGTRHVLCESLSTQATAYYTGKNTWDALSALEGKETTSSVTAAGSPLFNALHDLMWNTLTTTVSYKSLTTYWSETDRSGGSSDASLIYCDEISSSYNREHVWPKSHGNFYESGAGSDLHHLRPSNSTINSTRSHYTFGNVRKLLSSYKTASYGGKTVLWYDSGYSGNSCLGLVEVNDNIKGDIARILLYVYVTYGKTTGENLNLFTKTGASGSGNNANTGDKIIYDLDTLLEWCENDPVDTWEMSRNDCCANVQGNRNVFIDYPEFAWLLFGQEVPDMDTPSGMAHEMQGGTSYTVTAVSSDETMGTVTGSGRAYTANPNAGYYVSGYTLEPSDAATVTQEGNSFHLSKPTADCTLTILFAAKEKATVSYIVPDGVSAKQTDSYLGDTIRLGTPSGMPTDTTYEYAFAGWVKAPVADTTDKPEFLRANSEYRLTDKQTVFYALYTYVVSDGGSTADGEFSLAYTVGDGIYVIAAPGSNVMVTNENPGTTFLAQDAATIEGDVITNAKDDNIFRFEAVGASYAIYDCTGAALCAGGSKNVYLDAEKTEVTASDSAYLWNVTIDKEGTAVLTPAGNAGLGTLQYNAGAPRFTLYTSSQQKLSLYGGTSGTRHYLTLDGVTPQPCEHANTELRDAKEPTCTEPGYTGDLFCTDCKELLEQGEMIAALGHDFVDGFCTRCGEEDPSHDPTVDPCEGYTDIDRSSWYHPYADFVIENGLMGSTTPDGLTFEPTTSCTRSMIVTILYSLAGKPEVTFEDVFPDVKDNQWYTAPVMWAYQHGVVSGYDNGNFGTNDKITREQMAVILKAYAEKIDSTDTSAREDLTGYPDHAKVTWSKDAVSWAVAEGLISGKAVGTQTLLDPQGNASRAEAAVILMKFLSK